MLALLRPLSLSAYSTKESSGIAEVQDLLVAKTVLEIGELNSVIGRVAGAPGAAANAVEAVLKTMSKGDLSDAARLGKALSLSLNDNGLPSSADWNVSPA